MNGISPEGLEFIRQVKLPEELGLLRKIGTIPLRFESVSLMRVIWIRFLQRLFNWRRVSQLPVSGTFSWKTRGDDLLSSFWRQKLFTLLIQLNESLIRMETSWIELLISSYEGSFHNFPVDHLNQRLWFCLSAKLFRKLIDLFNRDEN